jgi:hypothetical protein
MEQIDLLENHTHLQSITNQPSLKDFGQKRFKEADPRQ